MRQSVAVPALDGQALAALKAWLAITGTHDDALLVDGLAAACALCESFTGVVPLLAHFRETFPADCPVLMPQTRPVRSVLAVTGVGAAADRPLAESAYDAVITTDGALSLQLRIAVAEPVLAVDYTAGSAADWDTLDPGLRHGLLRHAAHLYRERDSGRSDPLPAAVAALWRPYRQVRL